MERVWHDNRFHSGGHEGRPVSTAITADRYRHDAISHIEFPVSGMKALFADAFDWWFGVYGLE
jgi:hypothetical protein